MFLDESFSRNGAFKFQVNNIPLFVILFYVLWDTLNALSTVKANIYEN